MSSFIEISFVVVAALCVACVMRLLKQPLIIGYLLTGILLGPYGMNVLNDNDTFQIFSKLGITILLFIVGLNLNPSVIRDVGKISLYAASAQIIVTTFVGYLLGIALGLPSISAIYLALAVTFSSTIIILKLIADKGDLQSLYGKISIGLLLIQDVVAMLILLFISLISGDGSQSSFIPTILMVVNGLMIIVAIIALQQFIIPAVGVFIAGSQELLFLFSLAWGMGIAALFQFIGFSHEIGALIAGVSLSMTPYSYEISSRLRPLRDFFILLFFILLGSQLTFFNIGDQIPALIIFVIFVLVGQPIIMMLIMNMLGFTRRVSFQTSMVVAQVSEFSLILAAVGMRMGHLSPEVVSLITLIGLITIGFSSYLITYSDKLFFHIEKLLVYFELRVNHPRRMRRHYLTAVLFGFSTMGKEIIPLYESLGAQFTVIDVDPDIIHLLEKKHISARYGDARDPEFLQELAGEKLQYIVSGISDFQINFFLVRRMRKAHPHAILIVLAKNEKDALALYDAGASVVILFSELASRHTKKLLMVHGTTHSHYRYLKEKHIQSLSDSVI